MFNDKKSRRLIIVRAKNYEGDQLLNITVQRVVDNINIFIKK